MKMFLEELLEAIKVLSWEVFSEENFNAKISIVRIKERMADVNRMVGQLERRGGDEEKI